MKKKQLLFPVLTLGFLICIYFFLYKILIPRVNAFGCFDDCFNFMGGYFILKGKQLYSEVFFNHNMLMAYISYVVQSVKSPTNIYELVLIHRQLLLLFSFIMNLLIILRFRFVGMGFVLFYEFTKFYLFGDRFLAEGFIVYPLVYMGGLIWYKMKKSPLRYYDYILTALFTWFVIFMREPYIPLAIILFAIVLYGKPFSSSKRLSLGIFTGLTTVLLAITPLQDYYFNVITINKQTILNYETSRGSLGPLGLMKMFFYPLFLFWGGEWNIFRYILIGLNSMFLFISGYFIYRRKYSKYLAAIFIILGIANARVVTPGHVFYEAFHMLPWYGLFLFFGFSLLQEFYKIRKNFARLLTVFTVGLLIYFFLPPNSYIHEKQYPHETFITNYGRELQAGEGIKKLSIPSDTIFIDGFDDLIYWQADRPSAYHYSWYTSVMPQIDLYSTARLTMFEKNPPDFYYGSCPKERNAFRLLPESQQKNYIRLREYGHPSCMFVHKEKLTEITQDQWKMAEELGYTLQKNQENDKKKPEDSL